MASPGFQNPRQAKRKGATWLCVRRFTTALSVGFEIMEREISPRPATCTNYTVQTGVSGGTSPIPGGCR